MNKFEKLIEYVINDDTDKARALFHEIVVEKSRQIYEDIMDSELDNECSIGGDSSDDLIDDVETEEEGLSMEGEDDDEDAEFDDEAEEDGEDLTHDLEDEHDDEEDFGDDDFGDDDFGDDDGEGDLEDRVVDLEDKLDELMSEFESMLGGEGDDDFGDEEEFSDTDVDFDVDGGDELAVDDTEDFSTGGKFPVAENVKLDAAPKPTNSEESFVNKKATTAFNSGAIGSEAKPVKMTGDIAKGRPTPTSGNLPDAGNYRNVPGKGTKNGKLEAAPKPVTSQATGVNTRTPFPKG